MLWSDEIWQVVVGTFSIRTAVRKGASVETYIWYHNGTQPITPSATLRAEHPITELSSHIWLLDNQSEQSIFSLMNIVGLIWSLAQSTTYVRYHLLLYQLMVCSSISFIEFCRLDSILILLFFFVQLEACAYLLLVSIFGVTEVLNFTYSNNQLCINHA